MSVWTRSKNDLYQLAKDLQMLTLKRRTKHGRHVTSSSTLEDSDLMDLDKIETEKSHVKDSLLGSSEPDQDLDCSRNMFRDPRISRPKETNTFTISHSVSASEGDKFVTNSTAQKCSITDGNVRLHRAPTSVTTFRPISPPPLENLSAQTQNYKENIDRTFTLSRPRVTSSPKVEYQNGGHSTSNQTSNAGCQTLPMPFRDRLGTGTTCSSFASSVDSVSSRSVDQETLKHVLDSVSNYTNQNGRNKHLTKILRLLCKKQRSVSESNLDSELSDVKKLIGDLQQVCVGLSRFQPDNTSMESQSSTVHLDTEFDKVLVDMKPYVLKLPEKSDRQKCAVWIKKLCEPSTSGVSNKRNRNLHAQLMLKMLRRGTLQSPFDKKPENGALPPLPSYMSIYFDEPMNSPVVEDKTPDWVSGELSHSVGSSLFYKSTFGDPSATSTFLTSSSLKDIKDRPYSSLGVTLDRDPLLSMSHRDEKSVGFALDDMSLDFKSSPTHSQLDRERRTLPDVRSRISHKSPDRRHTNQVAESDWIDQFTTTTDHLNPSISSKGSGYSDKPFSLRSSEVETKLKMLEVKFHEEKVKLQHKHDNSVQKIIDRKNMEIESLKSEYNSKIKELEEVVTKLDKKVQSLVRESSTVRETKEKQVTELKKMIEDTEESKKYQYEKKLHDVITEFEQDKFEMQKHHTRNIQEILDETNIKLQRMEKEYGHQTTATSNVIKDLENRVQQLTTEADNTLKQRATIEMEKNELQIKVDRLTANLEDTKDRFSQLDREYKNMIENHKHDIKGIKSKTEASLEYIKQEQTISSSKSSETILDLEHLVEQLKKSLKDTEESTHRQLREKDHEHQQDKIHLENLHDKQARSLRKELDQFEQDTGKKIKRLEHTLQDKEEELNRLREQNRDQSAQADRALEEFKLQVERNQSRMYDETKQQMNKVQNDLNKSKQSREKQSQEFSRQLEEERFQHDKELAELKIVFDNDKSQLLHDFHVQKEFILTEGDKALESIKEMHRQEINSLENKLRDVQDRDNKMIRDLETQQRELREESVQSNQLRKQQLVELGLLRDEEKQRMQRDHEMEISRSRTETEQKRLELQKQHSIETEQMLQKTNDRLKDIERENSDKIHKSSETIASLQASIDHLRLEIKRIRECSDKKLADTDQFNEEEKKSIKRQFSASIQKMQHELDIQRNKVRSLDKKLQREEADHEEKITKLKLTYEDRIRGLVPLEVRQELEETIGALKSQVNSVQQRANVLQEEVDNRIQSPHTMSSSKSIKTV